MRLSDAIREVAAAANEKTHELSLRPQSRDAWERIRNELYTLAAKTEKQEQRDVGGFEFSNREAA